jgi:uncharacterized protein
MVMQPLPALNNDTRDFWTGGSNNRLMINRCRQCRRWSHPPVPVCRWCRSLDIGPEQSVGTGAVLTYTVNRHQWQPQLPADYTIAVVELDDEPGLRLTTRLVGLAPEDVHPGLRVAVQFERVADVWLPLFHPEGAT